MFFTNPNTNTAITCPSCHNQRAPVTSISVVPLPAAKFEEAYISREQDIESSNSKPATSILSALCPEKKRTAVNRLTIKRTCRTGRWSSEESALVDRIIRSFDAGLLPLPHGIKLNVRK